MLSIIPNLAFGFAFNMNKPFKIPNEDEIDEIVEAQADDDSAWGKLQKVRKPKGPDVPLPSELAARAAFFARVHHEASLHSRLH